MPNTITQRTIRGAGGDRKIVRLIHILSDGSEETDLVIYDNSAFINNTARGSLESIKASGSDCLCRLEWDQTTDSPVISFNPTNNIDMKFCHFGGIDNPNGTGATGDLVLTTSGLDAGDEVFILITIKQ